MIHDFDASLALSKAYENAPWWREVYSKAFPGLASMVSVRSDGWAQRGGIDRVLTMKSGKTLTVDEKVRSKSYADILLERWSNRERQVPGWMQKDLACDFIAYAFIPDRRCYLFSFPQLRAAWLDAGREWIAQAEKGENGFGVKFSKNKGYVTENIAVPIPEILSALHRAQLVEWAE